MSTTTFDKFYQLKKKYSQANKRVNKTLSDGTLTTITKKCVSCNQPGGINFEQHSDELIAMCGAETPCELDIRVTKKPYYMLHNYNNDLKTEIDRLKNEIIVTNIEMKLKFSDDLDSTSRYELIKNRRDQLIVESQKVKEQITKTLRNDETNKRINELQERMTNEIFVMKQGNLTIQEIANIQVNEIKPLADEIRGLKYKINKVVHDAEFDERILIQNSHTIHDLYANLD